MLALKGQRPDEKVLERMVETLRHRGPDDSGIMVSGPCGLGNTRLAIIDLSAAGHQPMHASYTASELYPSKTREAWIAYNGEVYNFAEVRAALRANRHVFISGTDTETLLHAYLQYGSPGFIHPFRGMFSLAIWDVAQQSLVLARDRLGQKPLYYCVTSDWIVFGSEIKSLLAHPDVPKRLNERVVSHYLAYGYAPSPETLFDGIYSLPPGYMLTVDLRADGAPCPKVEAYWQPPYPAAEAGRFNEDELTAELLNRLREAVRIRMIADVPLGAFLSGGLDSAAIVALMAQESAQAIKTFSIGFANEPSFDETAHARRVATRFVTEHHEFIVEPQVIDLLDELLDHHDQPFGDSSAIPAYLVSKLAREYVTVALTGDGGDELFAGYERFYAAQLSRTYARLPGVVHRAVGGAIQRLPQSTTYRDLARRADRFVQGASLPFSARYLGWVRYVPSLWVAALRGEAEEAAVQSHYDSYFTLAPVSDREAVAQLLDVNLRTYLPDDLLVKVDRTSMAVSLEARSPFLDHTLMQFAASLSPDLKMRRGTTKYILKKALRGLLPDSIIDRKKHGFGVPVGAWFRGDLAAYVQAVLLSERAASRGLFSTDAVRAMLNAHQSEEADLGHALWTLLIFEMWMQRYFD
jgi:asparagine synthase (glutamine-hydrolysing)